MHSSLLLYQVSNIIKCWSVLALRKIGAIHVEGRKRMEKAFVFIFAAPFWQLLPWFWVIYGDLRFAKSLTFVARAPVSIC